jgi:hypothetical protein
MTHLNCRKLTRCGDGGRAPLAVVNKTIFWSSLRCSNSFSRLIAFVSNMKDKCVCKRMAFQHRVQTCSTAIPLRLDIKTVVCYVWCILLSSVMTLLSSQIDEWPEV